MSKLTIYELAVLYYPEIESDLKTVSVKIKQLIEASAGKILKEDAWGKRQLAYPIKKQTTAIYVFYDLELAPNQLAKLETSFNIAEEIMRYQFYKPDLKALAKALAQPPKSQAEAVATKPVKVAAGGVN